MTDACKNITFARFATRAVIRTKMIILIILTFSITSLKLPIFVNNLSQGENWHHSENLHANTSRGVTFETKGIHNSMSVH